MLNKTNRSWRFLQDHLSKTPLKNRESIKVATFSLNILSPTIYSYPVSLVNKLYINDGHCWITLFAFFSWTAGCCKKTSNSIEVWEKAPVSLLVWNLSQTKCNIMLIFHLIPFIWFTKSPSVCQFHSSFIRCGFKTPVFRWPSVYLRLHNLILEVFVAVSIFYIQAVFSWKK